MRPGCRAAVWYTDSMIDANELERLTPQALTELMRKQPSHPLYELGSLALEKIAQAQTTEHGIDSTLSWKSQFEQAYDGYWQAEVLGFRE